MNIFDEAEIRVASLASVTQSLSESGIGPTTTSSSVCVSVFDFVLTFTLGLRPRFLWFSIWTTVVVIMMTLVMAISSSPSSAGAPIGCMLLCTTTPSMICARGAVLLDGELGRGRLTAAFSFSTATAWGHLSWLV